MHIWRNKIKTDIIIFFTTQQGIKIVGVGTVNNDVVDKTLFLSACECVKLLKRSIRRRMQLTLVLCNKCINIIFYILYVIIVIIINYIRHWFLKAVKNAKLLLSLENCCESSTDIKSYCRILTTCQYQH